MSTSHMDSGFRRFQRHLQTGEVMKKQSGQPESHAITCLQPIHGRFGAVGVICRKRTPVLGCSYFSQLCQLRFLGSLHPDIVPHLSAKVSFSIPHLKITCITTGKLFTRFGYLGYNRYGQGIFSRRLFEE